MVNVSMDGFSFVHIEDSQCSVLKEKRQVLRLTQQEVADRAKISLQQYQKFESGQRNIKTASFQLACRVIEALEMNVSNFFHGDYVFGEEVYDSPEGLRYKKTGELITKDF